MRTDMIDLTGKTFGKLLVTKYSHGDGNHSFWVCVCDCGKIRIVRSDSFTKSNPTLSCGRCKYKSYLDANKGLLYHSYQKNAKSRGLAFKLNFDEFINITSSICYYCGKEPIQIYDEYNGKQVYHYNGIDRVNNELGYLSTNVVSCCVQCNRSKMAYTKEDYIQHIKRSYLHLKQNGMI